MSLELAETSDAIARTMAEAATANFFTEPASTVLPPTATTTAISPPGAEGADAAAAVAAAAAAASGDAGMGASTGNVAAVHVGGGGAASSAEVGAAGSDGGVAGVGRRSRAEAQAEVERLKARQAELFEMIQEEKEVRVRQASDGKEAKRVPVSCLEHHCDCLAASVQFPPLGHRFVSNFLLEDAQRTRRHIISRVWGSCDTGSASYGRRKPPKLALFCGVPIYFAA